MTDCQSWEDRQRMISSVLICENIAWHNRLIRTFNSSTAEILPEHPFDMDETFQSNIPKLKICLQRELSSPDFILEYWKSCRSWMTPRTIQTYLLGLAPIRNTIYTLYLHYHYMNPKDPNTEFYKRMANIIEERKLPLLVRMSSISKLFFEIFIDNVQLKSQLETLKDETENLKKEYNESKLDKLKNAYDEISRSPGKFEEFLYDDMLNNFIRTQNITTPKYLVLQQYHRLTFHIPYNESRISKLYNQIAITEEKTDSLYEQINELLQEIRTEFGM